MELQDTDCLIAPALPLPTLSEANKGSENIPVRRAQGTLGTYPSKPAEFVIHSFMRVFPYITGGVLTIIYPGYHLICLQHAIESGEHPLQTGNQFGIIKNHLTEIGDAIESPQLMVKSPIRNR